MSLYPNPFIGPGACRGGNGYCATHEQPVLACENERLLTENVVLVKRADKAEADLARVRALAHGAADSFDRLAKMDDPVVMVASAAVAAEVLRAALEGQK